MEPPAYEKIDQNAPPDFFNISITFRRDSSIWIPYDIFEPIDYKNKNPIETWTDKQVDERVIKKNKLLLQFVSNCAAHSQREKLVNLIRKRVNVTTYGKCNDKPCNNDCANGELGGFLGLFSSLSKYCKICYFCR